MGEQHLLNMALARPLGDGERKREGKYRNGTKNFWENDMKIGWMKNSDIMPRCLMMKRSCTCTPVSLCMMPVS